MLNRVSFARVLLLVIRAEKEIEDEALGYVKEFEYGTKLKIIFQRFIVPFLTDKEPDQLPTSLNAFRDRYVWVEKVNSVIEINLEGIMDVFSKFCEEIGFTLNSAMKVLKGMGCLIP